jgi:branched-chain amino acid transport system permease protein
MPSTSLLVQGLALGILTGGVYALLASGLTLYFGVMRVVQIAHPAFLFLAAYLTYSLYTVLGVDPLLSMVFTVPLFFFLGVGFQRYLLARLAGDDLAMMSVLLTFAAAVVIEGGLGLVYSGSYRSVTVDYATQSFSFLGAALPYDRVIGFVVASVTLAVLFVILKKTRYGQALRATMQHPTAARLIGVDTERARAIGFGIGLSTAAVGGAVLALIQTFFPAGHYAWIAKLMAIIVVGGLGSVSGAAAAAILLGVLEALVLVTLDATWAALIFYAFLFFTLIFKPEGFFGGSLAERY